MHYSMKGKATIYCVYGRVRLTERVVCSLKACSKFVNNNEVTRLAKSSAKSPELLAKFCDTLLRKRYKYVILCSYSAVCLI